MDWIECYVNSPNKLKGKSLTEGLKRLNLEDSQNFNWGDMDELEDKKIKAFNLASLKSTIQKLFKDSYYSQNIQEPIDEITNHHSMNYSKDQNQENRESLISFSLMQTTPFEAFNIIITVEINLKTQYIRYSSFPAKNLQMLVFTLEQINILSRLITLNLNERVKIGCLSIDPESGCLNYQIVNNSLGHLHRRIHKAPNDLVKSIETQIIQIEKSWKTFLPSIFNLLNLPERRQKDHPFWKTYKQKINIYDTEQFNLLTEYIKQSYMEHPFMFEQQIRYQNPERREIRHIRYNYLSKEEKNRKKYTFEQLNKQRNYYASIFTNSFSNLLSTFTSKEQIKIEIDKKKYELPEQKKSELSKKLIITNFQSRFPIYSEIQINQIKKEQTLIKSNFSQLKLLQIIGKKSEDDKPTFNLIVSKTTQPTRFINETDILKIIADGKSMFITRYYFSRDQQNKILLEYCPQKSIDAYLHSHKKIISLQTKIYFMFEISIGLRFLRDYKVVHNDLKPQNVLLKIVSDKNKNNGTFLLRLIDFGQSQTRRDHRQENKYKRGYTIPYASPEQTKSDNYSQKNDVFSYGVVLYQIMFDTFPVQILRRGKQIYANEEEYLKFYAMAPQKCKYYSLPKIMQVIFQLCLRCLNPNPNARPSIDWIYLIVKETLSFSEKVIGF